MAYSCKIDCSATETRHRRTLNAWPAALWSINRISFHHNLGTSVTEHDAMEGLIMRAMLTPIEMSLTQICIVPLKVGKRILYTKHYNLSTIRSADGTHHG